MPKRPAHDEESERRVVAKVEAARRARLLPLLDRRSKLTDGEIEDLRAAFPLLVKTYRPGVWKRLLRRGVPREDAKDLVVGVFKTLFERICEHGFPANVAAMVQKMTTFALLNFVHRGERSLMDGGLPSSGSQPAASDARVDSNLDRAALRRRVMAQLSDEQRDLVELVLEDHMEQADAAEALDIPVGTLKSQLRAAKNRLLELIAEARAEDAEGS
jgi:RNA polymerase sigma-70 factor, ECF subfamily